MIADNRPEPVGDFTITGPLVYTGDGWTELSLDEPIEAPGGATVTFRKHDSGYAVSVSLPSGTPNPMYADGLAIDGLAAGCSHGPAD